MPSHVHSTALVTLQNMQHYDPDQVPTNSEGIEMDTKERFPPDFDGTSTHFVDGSQLPYNAVKDDDALIIKSSEFPEFLSVVKGDDVGTFFAWPPHRQQLYFHGHFVYNEKQPDFAFHHPVGRRFQRPLYLAAGHGALGLVKEFVSRGADITKPDASNYNILHILALAASMCRENEEDFIDITDAVLDLMPELVMVRLCFQENDDGLRPLELASILGSFAVFNTLLRREGYLRGRASLMGFSAVYHYDISDYEPGGGLRRMIRSPIRMMVYVDRPGFDSLRNFGTLKLPFIRRWTNHLKKSCLPFLMMWWILRFVYLVSVSYLDPSILLYQDICTNFTRKPYGKDDHHNKMEAEQCDKMGNETTSHLGISLGLNKGIEVWSAVMIAIEILEVVLRLSHSDRRKAYRHLYFRKCFSFTWSYRFSTFLLYVVALLAPTTAKKFKGGEAFQYLLFVKAFQLPLCLYSFLHMIEFMPVLGIFAITIQRMIKTLAVFLVFLLPVKGLFCQFFTFFASSEGFSGFWSGVYLLFMLDMGSFDFGTTPSLVVMIVHVFYFLVVIILLFNYLIAVLSLVADETSEDRRQLVELRRLQMLTEVEERVSYWFWLLVRKLWKRKYRTVIVA